MVLKSPWSMLILLSGGALLAQATHTDTLNYPELGLTTMSDYRLVPVEELSRAELFQRGITPGATSEPIRIVDSVRVIDAAGQSVPYDSFLELRKPQIDSLNAVRQRERVVRQEPARYLNSLLHAPGGKTIYYGRVGEELRDTLTLSNYERAHNTAYLHSTLVDFRVADSVVFAEQGSVALPFTYRFTGASERTTLRGGYANKDTAFVLSLTLEGYQLSLSDFQDRVPTQPTLHLRPRPELRLYLPGPEKLLTILRDGEVQNRVPVGRMIDTLDVSNWVPGDYVLRLSNLGSGSQRFALLRVVAE